MLLPVLLIAGVGPLLQAAADATGGFVVTQSPSVTGGFPAGPPIGAVLGLPLLQGLAQIRRCPAGGRGTAAQLPFFFGSYKRLHGTLGSTAQSLAIEEMHA